MTSSSTHRTSGDTVQVRAHDRHAERVLVQDNVALIGARCMASGVYAPHPAELPLARRITAIRQHVRSAISGCGASLMTRVA